MEPVWHWRAKKSAWSKFGSARNESWINVSKSKLSPLLVIYCVFPLSHSKVLLFSEMGVKDMSGLLVSPSWKQSFLREHAKKTNFLSIHYDYTPRIIIHMTSIVHSEQKCSFESYEWVTAAEYVVRFRKWSHVNCSLLEMFYGAWLGGGYYLASLTYIIKCQHSKSLLDCLNKQSNLGTCTVFAPIKTALY